MHLKLILLFAVTFVSCVLAQGGGRNRDRDRGGDRGGNNRLRRCRGNNGSRCVFPFIYRGREFKQCTRFNSESGLPWCAQEVNGRGRVRRGRWDDCDYSTDCECCDDRGQRRNRDDDDDDGEGGPQTQGGPRQGGGGRRRGRNGESNDVIDDTVIIVDTIPVVAHLNGNLLDLVHGSLDVQINGEDDTVTVITVPEVDILNDIDDTVIINTVSDVAVLEGDVPFAHVNDLDSFRDIVMTNGQIDLINEALDNGILDNVIEDIKIQLDGVGMKPKTTIDPVMKRILSKNKV